MKRKDYRLQHPLAIVYAFSKYIILLLLPLLRSVTLFTSDFYTWLEGVWLDVLVLLAIILFGTLRWNCIRFQVGEDWVDVRSGVFIARRRRICYSNISSVIIEHIWYLRPVKAVRVRVETDSGNDEMPDIQLLLRREDAARIQHRLSSHLRQEQVLVRLIPPD